MKKLLTIEWNEHLKVILMMVRFLDAISISLSLYLKCFFYVMSVENGTLVVFSIFFFLSYFRYIWMSSSPTFGLEGLQFWWFLRFRSWFGFLKNQHFGVGSFPAIQIRTIKGSVSFRFFKIENLVFSFGFIFMYEQFGSVSIL